MAEADIAGGATLFGLRFERFPEIRKKRSDLRHLPKPRRRRAELKIGWVSTRRQTAQQRQLFGVNGNY